ncbi:Uncharacterized protein FWK35_00032889 [Aphis craccivora]|uniref:Uncharacterized protein n=1 Tax=Aphis craccivora TaxID=307492 RepID=A0A6G0VUW3_APHCR|nr:Uncharacterized protein FWK35_00032889 [Aphis craccivora]
MDSERSDECIDFTMLITSRNNALFSNFGGGFRWKSEYPWCIIEVKSKHFPTVLKKKIFLYGCNSKTNHCKYLKLSPNLNFQNILTFFDSNFYEICRKREICNISRRYLKILPAI